MMKSTRKQDFSRSLPASFREAKKPETLPKGRNVTDLLHCRRALSIYGATGQLKRG